jgi:Flp pilus assembly protein CpaB
MLNSFTRGFSKFFTTERLIILVVFLILAWGLLSYSGAKTLRVDSMETGAQNGPIVSQTSTTTTPAVVPSSDITTGYSMKASTNPQDLLPQDQNSQWAALNPVSQGNIAAPDLLQAGYHIGLDTIGQTLKNANLQERSDPIIPKTTIGPWNQSTIEPDLGRVPLEVGASSR